MNYLRTCRNQLQALSNWMIADPRRVASYLAVLMIVAVGVAAAWSAFLTPHAIYLAPNPPGGSGGPG